MLIYLCTWGIYKSSELFNFELKRKTKFFYQKPGVV